MGYLDTVYGCDQEIEKDGIKYGIRIMTYENTDGYATVIVQDMTNHESYISYGYIELNNHRITTKWKKVYDQYRDNWICSKDLEVTIE